MSPVCSPSDALWTASVRPAIADELTDDGYVLRYGTHETDDGLSGEEDTVLICSFWLVSALVIIGQNQRARDLMERLIRIASPLGLYAEEYDVATGRHLGNFPVGGVELVAASDPLDFRVLDDRVIDRKCVIPGDSEDVVDTNLVESP